MGNKNADVLRSQYKMAFFCLFSATVVKQKFISPVLLPGSTQFNQVQFNSIEPTNFSLRVSLIIRAPFINAPRVSPLAHHFPRVTSHVAENQVEEGPRAAQHHAQQVRRPPPCRHVLHRPPHGELNNLAVGLYSLPASLPRLPPSLPPSSTRTCTGIIMMLLIPVFT